MMLSQLRKGGEVGATKTRKGLTKFMCKVQLLGPNVGSG